MRNAKKLLLLCIFVGTAGLALADTCRVVVNGRPIRFPGDAEPYFKNGTWVIPARAVLNAAGVRYDYNSGSQTLTIKQGNPYFRIEDGSRTMEFDNGRRQNLRAEAKVYSGEIHVPLEFLEKAIGSNADWDSRNRALIFQSRSGGNAGWGHGIDSDSPWYGGGGNSGNHGGGNQDDNWNRNPTSFLILNKAADGNGTMNIDSAKGSKIYRAQVNLDNRGGAELRFWTDKSGQVSMKGRYTRRGSNVTVDLWQGFGNAYTDDRVKGSVTLSRDGRSFTAISVNGKVHGAPFNANFSAR